MTSTMCDKAVNTHLQTPVTMEELIEQYRFSLSRIRELQKTANEDDYKLLSSMASDMQYALDWMSTGRPPGLRRGIEQRAAYQNEKLTDPLIIQRYFRSEEPQYEWDDHEKEHQVTGWERDQLDCSLSSLTEREREIYLMKRGYSVSYKEIARMLNITVANARNTVHQSEKKMRLHTRDCLICSLR